MREAALFLAVPIASYLGFALLALSQDHPWELVTGARHCPKRLVVPLRFAGAVLLALSVGLSIVVDGPAFGSLLGVAMLSNGALAVVATLTWRSHWMRPLVRPFQHID